MELSRIMEDSITASRSNKGKAESPKNNKGKGELLNNIVNELMVNCDSLSAVIIADWQGLSFASKLPQDVNEEEISATTLFTLEGAEGTRKELERSLLGKKLSYLIMVTEKSNKSAYMYVFPISKLGYIACISEMKEDAALIVQNMKTAVKKAEKILAIPESQIVEESVEPLITSKYNNLMKKLEALKSLKLSFFDKTEQIPTQDNPILISNGNGVPLVEEAPPIEGPLSPPETPLDFIEVETELDPLEPEILSGGTLGKFQVVFVDSKNIKYTILLDALDELDVEVRLKERHAYHPLSILSISRIE